MTKELHTIEISHDKPRLTQPRPSDVGTVETGADRDRDHDHAGRFKSGNKAARGRAGRRALTGPLRAARARVAAAVEGKSPSVEDAILDAAMVVYGTTTAELGSSSLLVNGPLVAFASESVLAGHFLNCAAERGFETKDGARFLELAHACQQQSQRAMTAALAALKALSGTKPNSKPHKSSLFEDE